MTDLGLGSTIILRAMGITKRFPGVLALSDVDLDVYRGEVLALLGENGAGKSTLIKILSGVYTLDEGTIEMEGRSVRFNTPSEAKDAGIGIIHQELNYVAPVSVAENLYMGEIPRKGLFIDYPALYAGARQIMERVGIDVDPRRSIGSCTVSQKQLLEIAKVMSHEVKVLIMDEPTSALNDVETQNLFKLIKRAAASGISVIYISHKLDEIFALADRVVVLRDGCVTGKFMVAETTREQLIATMVGRKLETLYTKTPAKPADVAIEVHSLTSNQLHDITFHARKGEIFGIYGLLGSGHQEIGSAIFGQTLIESGEIVVDGKSVVINSPLDALQHGIAYVPAERKVEGLVLNNTVRVNILVSFYAKEKRRKVINRKFEQGVTRKWIDSLRIKTPSGETITESLSVETSKKWC